MPPSLPAYQLYNFLRGPEIQIFHAPDDTHTPEPLYTTFPIYVATHFSPFCKDCFPPETSTHVQRRGCNGKDTLTIYGGAKSAFIQIFNWMLASCAYPSSSSKGKRNGNDSARTKTKPKTEAKIEFLSFAEYAHIFKAAELLDVEPVRTDMWDRMSRMAAKQAQTIDDVKIVYRDFPADAPVRKLLARCIGDALMERRLRNFKAYREFKEKCVEYERDVYKYMDWKKARERGTEQRESRKTATAVNSETEKPSTGPAGDGAVTRTISAPITRKGQRGRPSYAQIALQDLGI